MTGTPRCRRSPARAAALAAASLLLAAAAAELGERADCAGGAGTAIQASVENSYVTRCVCRAGTTCQGSKCSFGRMTLRNGSSVPGSAFMLTGMSPCSDCSCVRHGGVKSNAESGHVTCVMGPDGPTAPMGSPPLVALFMRTYHGDLEWLDFSLASVQMFALAVLAEVVVAYPDADEAVVGTYLQWKFPWVKRVRLDSEKAFLKCQPDGKRHGYAAQIYDKMMPQEYVSSDIKYIMNVDSDSIFERPLELADLFAPPADGTGGCHRLRMQRRPWSQAGPDATKAWRNSTEAAVGSPVGYSHMLRQGQTYPVWLYKSVVSHLQRVHGVGLLDFHLSKYCPEGIPHVSEFEILGAVATLDHERSFFWEETPEQFVVFPVMQMWSWGGLTEAIRALYTCCLSHAVKKTVGPEGKVEWENVGYLRAPGHRPDPYGRCVELERAARPA